jgi:DNA-binding PadR family transcriptional regulator
MPENLSPFLPLSPASLHILLSLAAEDLHGYGIMLEVARQSAGQYRLGPGTLYDNLQKMTEQGLVEDAPSPRREDARREDARREDARREDARRKYYRLTFFGRKVLSAEIARLETLVRDAKAQLRRPAGRTS